jgi:WD40 repeat protein
MTFEKGHTAGIHCVEWCLTDPTLVLSGGRDNKVIVWNYETNESVKSIQFDKQKSQIISIAWGNLPGIFSVTFPDDIQIFRLGSENEQLTDYAPKWL